MTELCTAIGSEQDAHKMAELMEELNRLLETKQERLDRNSASQGELSSMRRMIEFPDTQNCQNYSAASAAGDMTFVLPPTMNWNSG